MPLAMMVRQLPIRIKGVGGRVLTWTLLLEDGKRTEVSFDHLQVVEVDGTATELDFRRTAPDGLYDSILRVDASTVVDIEL